MYGEATCFQHMIDTLCVRLPHDGHEKQCSPGALLPTAWPHVIVATQSDCSSLPAGTWLYGQARHFSFQLLGCGCIIDRVHERNARNAVFTANSIDARHRPLRCISINMAKRAVWEMADHIVSKASYHRLQRLCGPQKMAEARPAMMMRAWN